MVRDIHPRIWVGTPSRLRSKRSISAGSQRIAPLDPLVRAITARPSSGATTRCELKPGRMPSWLRDAVAAGIGPEEGEAHCRELPVKVSCWRSNICRKGFGFQDAAVPLAPPCISASA